MTFSRFGFIVFVPVLALFGSNAATQSTAGRVLVLEDFETPQAKGRWQGPLEILSGRASHGGSAARVRVDGRRTQISSTHLEGDWRGYDRLLFDVYKDSAGISFASIRIYDAVGGTAASAPRNEYFNGDGKILLLNGWTHVEVKLTPLIAATFERDMALDRIRQLTLSFEPGPTAVLVDNLRLVSGVEPVGTKSHEEPEDAVSIVDNRWITARQTVRPDLVPESSDVIRLRKDAEREADLLQKTVDAAHTQGIETIYAERRLVTADLGLRVRPLLAWFNNDDRKREMFSWVAQSCQESRRELEDLLRGSTLRAEVDDTQAGESAVRPYPGLKGLRSDGWFFRDEHGEPLLILSLHSPSQALQRFFASPLQHIESYSVGGGSRWTIDQSPVYKVFQEDRDTHRVGWDGWCGHLVRDLDSMGGTKKENVVICLENPRIREAVAQYIRENIPRMHRNPQLLYDIMAYELTYMCYCQRSQKAFRDWLERRHGSIGQANQCWGTSYASFRDVLAPPVKDQRPVAGTNRGLWYDWTRFNQDRFTDYLLWVRGEIRRLDGSVPLAAGGSSSMLAGHTGTSGIDEERIVNEVDDVIIHEGGGSTLGMDLQMALSERKKPLADPEMSLGQVEYLLPHFLHGKSVAQLYHWPTQPANEYHSNDRESLAHSWDYSLRDVDEVLRAAIDVRRLNKEIAAFVDAPAEIAILYSQTSTLQLPPEMLTWRTTPYLAELQRAYEASRTMDAKVTFVTERQVLHGALARYRLLLIPGVRNIPAEVVKAIHEYVAGGGRALILPESLLGDEYNRPQPFLAQFGVTVRSTERPRAAGSGRMVQGYDQSFAQDVAFNGGASATLTAAVPEFAAIGPLATAGVRQTLDPAANAQVLYRYGDGKPAIVRTRIGNGVADYSGASLADGGYAGLVDALAGEAGVSRPVRVRFVSAPEKDVEVRFARLGERRLLYVFNANAHPVRARLETSEGRIASLTELRSGQHTSGGEVTVPPHQTNIYELF